MVREYINMEDVVAMFRLAGRPATEKRLVLSSSQGRMYFEDS